MTEETILTDSVMSTTRQRFLPTRDSLTPVVFVVWSGLGLGCRLCLNKVVLPGRQAMITGKMRDMHLGLQSSGN